MPGPKPLDPHERFESKIDKTGPCWAWCGGLHKNGYGLFYVKIVGAWKTVWAHRFAFELYKEKLWPGDTVDHLCFNPRCVNPEHLEAVSIGVNTLRSPRTVSGINARKTHCPAGHLYFENGFLDSGKRRCRICVRAKNRRAHHRRRLVRNARACVPMKKP